MRYINSGSRDATQVVATWLRKELTSEVMELRWQTGYFASDALGLFAPVLQGLAASNLTVRVLIGSNESSTLWQDVLLLAEVLGIPRPNADLGVVQFANALFHPKAYHLRRTDGTQWAYVGSSNLTQPGLNGLNIEAGVILDTREGDSDGVLDHIAAAIDAWFTGGCEGLYKVAGPADVERLRDDGVLAVSPLARPAVVAPAAGGGASSALKHRLQPILKLPTFVGVGTRPSVSPASSGPALGASTTVTQAGFPPHVLFAPNATTPTIGAQALSGRSLPVGVTGAVVRLSGDTTRIFTGEEGTANMSLPTETIQTLRFGLQGRGRYPNRPRAEFDLMVRYVGRTNTFVLPDVLETNVMPYGYLPGEKGNKDIRMLIPAGVRALLPQLQGVGVRPPGDGDFALLEWPTPTDPSFRLTFLEPASPLAQRSQQLFADATAGRTLLGDNACGLPAGTSPPW